jgi:hypothetical protein
LAARAAGISDKIANQTNHHGRWAWSSPSLTRIFGGVRSDIGGSSLD